MMGQVCLMAYPRLVHLIAIKRLGIIDYLENVFNYVMFVSGARERESLRAKLINVSIAMESIDGTRSKWTKE